MAEQRRQDAAHLRQLGQADLEKKLAQMRQTLWNTEAKLRSGSLQKPHERRAGKRHIARLLTVLREQAAKPAAATTQAQTR